MKNFLIFLVLIFAGLFSAIYLKRNSQNAEDGRPVLKVFASSSFISQWGPGPWLKENFESTCDCRVEFQDSADSNILIQRLKSEGRLGGADVVLGFDQYDLELAQKGLEWKKMNLQDFDIVESVKLSLNQDTFIPYDWSLLSFVVRKSDFPHLPKNLDDLLAPEFKGQIVMEDPRTSSPGLQFLLWLIQLKGEEKAFDFLSQFNQHIHSYAPNWSSAYGLFQKAQVKSVYSYVTSPIYHLLEDKSTDVVALEFAEGHPMQTEFAGIPATCRNCELATQFVTLLMSKDAQKVIMEKNYMLPVINGVREGTVFSNLPNYKISDFKVLPSLNDRERILKKWSALRRGE